MAGDRAGPGQAGAGQGWATGMGGRRQREHARFETCPGDYAQRLFKVVNDSGDSSYTDGMNEEEKFLTTPEVAKLLGVTQACVNVWLRGGDFPNAHRINPMRAHSPWRVPRSDVDEFIEQRRKQRGYFYVPTKQKS